MVIVIIDFKCNPIIYCLMQGRCSICSNFDFLLHRQTTYCLDFQFTTSILVITMSIFQWRDCTRDQHKTKPHSIHDIIHMLIIMTHLTKSPSFEPMLVRSPYAIRANLWTTLNVNPNRRCKLWCSTKVVIFIQWYSSMGKD